MIRRSCNLLESNGFFLFGPRGVGKTTLVQEQFPETTAVYVDLLDIELVDQLMLNSGRFKAAKNLFIEIKSKNMVDESDAKALETLGRDTDTKAEKWLLSNDTLEHQFGQTRALHWQTAIRELFGH